MSRHQTNSPPVTIASVREHGDTLLPVLYLMVIAALLIKDAPRPVVTEDKAPIAKVEKAPIAKEDKSETASPQADDNGKPGSAPSVLPASPSGPTADERVQGKRDRHPDPTVRLSLNHSTAERQRIFYLIGLQVAVATS